MSEKVFRDTRTLIGILKGRGLVIRNKRRAKQIIREINYYNLINGYKEPFLQVGTNYEHYLQGTKFEEVYALYEFDRKLRIITLEYILEIEKQIKSYIAHCFSKYHGHRDYLRLENFDISSRKRFEYVSDLLSGLYKKIKMNVDKDLSISHYVSGKNYIPLWVLVNSISMGDISKFYSNMKQSERNDVAQRMKWGVRENELANCLFFLSAIRNRCAHDERLYSYLCSTNLHSNRYFRYFHVSVTNNYFAIMVAFKMLLSNKRYVEYNEKMEQLFDELSNNLHTITIGKIRSFMGIPSNWKKLKQI